MKKILIIEPDAAMGLFYVRSFTLTGFNAEYEPNYAKGVTGLNRVKPDLVLLNLLLPSRGAFKFLKQKGSVPWTCQVPVVGYLRKKRVDLIQDAADNGVNESVVVEGKRAEELIKSVSKFIAPQRITPSASVKILTPVFQKKTHPETLSEDLPKAGDRGRSISASQSDKRERKRAAKPTPLKTLSQLTELSHLLLQAGSSEAQVPLLFELYCNAQEMTEILLSHKRRADIWMSVALVSLIKKLHDNPRLITSSNRRTINQSIEYIGSAVDKPILESEEWEPSFRVLAVDDDIITSRTVEKALKLVDILPDSVNDSVLALKHARANTYDLFILDLNMPRLNGFELCQELRQTPNYKYTPVIFLTASDSFETRLKASGSGGSDFIGKPFELTELAVKAFMLLLTSGTQ